MDLAREIVDVAIESMMEAAAEVVSTISRVPVIAKMKEYFPDGMAKTTEMAGPPCLVKGIKVVES